MKKKARKKAAKKRTKHKVPATTRSPKRKKQKPSANGQTDRNSSGQFTNGNKAAVGNVKGSDRKARELKNALLEVVTEKDIEAIAKKLVAKSKKGDVPAIKELFDRLWGKAKYVIGEETINSLADIAARMGGNGTD